MGPRFTSMAASTCEGGPRTHHADVVGGFSGRVAGAGSQGWPGMRPSHLQPSVQPSGRDFGNHVLEPSIRLAVGRNKCRLLCITLIAHCSHHRRYTDLAVADLEILDLAADGLGGLGYFCLCRIHFSLRRIFCDFFCDFLGLWRTGLGWSRSPAEIRVKSCSIVTIPSQSAVHSAAVPYRPLSNRQRLVKRSLT